MLDIKELQQIATKEYEKIQEKNKQQKAKFTKKFISKVEKDIEKEAKAGAFSLYVLVLMRYWLDEEEFVAYFKKLGFSVTTKLYHYAGEHWFDKISWEVKNDTSRKR